MCDTFLQETVTAISDSGHTVDDIVFIGSEESGHCCSWEDFKVLADKEYEIGFGAAEVAQDLVIVFSDGQKMWRGEYDGSEWWEFSFPFKAPKKRRPIKYLFTRDVGAVGWRTLRELEEDAQRGSAHGDS